MSTVIATFCIKYFIATFCIVLLNYKININGGFDMSVGNLITKLRKKRNLTQEGLAERVGISRASLSHYEKDRREPDYETLRKLADFFEVSTDYLLGRSKAAKKTGNEEYDSIEEINRLLDKYEIDEMSFFDIDKWKSMSPEQIRELESYFQYLVQKSKEMDKK
ncbi:helix-turn-helix domain-containing protein [Halobacillus halophilus]|nr:helix-turn-helix transcriptional regulator [Halobacillus halophilus]